jgi:hypothetical protein
LRNDAAQSIGRILLVAVVLIALLAMLTTARYASTRRRRTPAAQTVTRPLKGDVRRGEGGKLQYFDGRQWADTPPPPQDGPF